MKKIILLILFIAILPLKSQAYTGVDGDLIKSPSSSSVYLVRWGGRRYVFPFQQVYAAYHGNNFSSVKTISDQEMSQLKLISNVFLPSNTLVKSQTNNKVYSTIFDDSTNSIHIKWIDSEQKAANLFGADWVEKIIDIPDAFWGDYQKNDITTVQPFFWQILDPASPSGNQSANQEVELLRFRIILDWTKEYKLTSFIGNIEEATHPNSNIVLGPCQLKYINDQGQWVVFNDKPHYPCLSGYPGCLPAYVFSNPAFLAQPQKEIIFAWSCQIPEQYQGFTVKARLGIQCSDSLNVDIPCSNTPTIAGNEIILK